MTISRTLGDNHNTVRRLVNGWYALKQASDDGFDREDRSKPRFAFSHLYTALTRASVREFLGLTPVTRHLREVRRRHRQEKRATGISGCNERRRD